ncbi:glutamate-5-semialdehyde dehydrogenase [Wenzhouxiangella marina]|uniref:Gamma-glutamyl phosphate reductase n=1 Tax=Wenzhouxiangella marina TaxID=1579979 RepID=A0A0K0XUP6_9GAMM|nr:glutamate-5-semialdehyde dehydrogenase [Wenzhouxiangella marina]AKS41341.1 Gamma-glutamyl phosphate reductase [Wenzhouxiangella marina]MBB6086909.1 glutamate-5-semialdehyde dehydrogenase [Wenzhouxiangella marina]
MNDDPRTHDALIRDLARAARKAVRQLAGSPLSQRNMALEATADRLRTQAGSVLEANEKDLAAGQARGLSPALLDRLRLDKDRLEAIAGSLETIVALPDPLHRIMDDWTRPNGLRIQRVAVPIGVIGVIYESRPNVTIDAAALCMKSGNAALLRGGSEAVHSNHALHRVLAQGLADAGLDPAAAQLLPTQDRAAVGALLRAHDSLDLVIPRGGKGLVKRVQDEARVPVLAHLDGNNHLYIHPSADVQMATAVVLNAKLRRPGICGALETLLIDRAWLDRAPVLLGALLDAGCELRGDATLRALDSRILEAREADWETEYLAPILAVRVVEDAEQALNHIARYGSGHTDGLIAEDTEAANAFLGRLDSAIAVHNASTQFADGGEFGFGAEIGIATGRLHARGPVGLEQLTTFQYRVLGSGQTRP